MLDLAPATARQSPTEASARRYTLASLSAGAAAVHLAVIPEHLTEYWPFAVFFAGVAAFQAAWAFAVLTRPQRGLYGLGAVASAGLITLWALSRTIGLPLGPEPWHPEAASLPDVAAVALEIGLILTIWTRGRLADPTRKPDRAITGTPRHAGTPAPHTSDPRGLSGGLVATKGGGYVQGMRLREDQHPTHAD